MSAEQQSMFLKAVKRLMMRGYGKAYETLMRAHGYSDPTEMRCQHRMETFTAWHRVYLHEFEVLLQDSYEELYGTRNIGIPYWDWTSQIFDPSIPKDIFKPEVQDDLDALSTPTTMRTLFGLRPGTAKVAKMYDKGFVLPNHERVFSHKIWANIKTAVEEYSEVMMTARTAGFWQMRHKAVNDFLEDMHAGIHIACGKPMSKLDTSVYAIYFWMHHANVDRLWESYLHEREVLDGTRSKVMSEFADDDPVTYQIPLLPFIRGVEIGPWTSGMVFSPQAFNAKYDKLFEPMMFMSEKTKAKIAILNATATNTSSASNISSGTDINLQAATTDPAPTDATQYAKIRFAKKGEHCTLTLYEESFTMHFFLKKKGESFTLPSTAGQLVSTPEWVGSGAHFGGMEFSEPYHVGEIELIIPIEGSLSDYEVEYLFEHDDEDEPRDDHPLLKKPDFWTITIGCDGKVPVPDKSWINLSPVDD